MFWVWVVRKSCTRFVYLTVLSRLTEIAKLKPKETWLTKIYYQWTLVQVYLAKLLKITGIDVGR